jgi:superfamily II DNA/RNA helicase
MLTNIETTKSIDMELKSDNNSGLDGESDDNSDNDSDSGDDSDSDDEFAYNDKFENMKFLDDKICNNIFTLGFEVPHHSQTIIDDLIKNHHKSIIIDSPAGTGTLLTLSATVASSVNTHVPCVQAIMLSQNNADAHNMYEFVCSLVMDTTITVAFHKEKGCYETNHSCNKLGTEQIIIGTPRRILSLFTEKNVIEQKYVSTPNFNQSESGCTIQLNANTVRQVILRNADQLLRPSLSRADCVGTSTNVMSLINKVKADQPYVRLILSSNIANECPCIKKFAKEFNI